LGTGLKTSYVKTDNLVGYLRNNGSGWTSDSRSNHFMYDENINAAYAILSKTSALLFPVTWDEPFGLALIEAMYHGAPVIATPFGSLPEIINDEVGVLSDSMAELIASARDHSRFSRRVCHEHVMDNFTSLQMTDRYLALYEKILNGSDLNVVSPYFEASSFTERYPIRD
ncbi:MAG: glycosyltransferase, partial [Ignavibacteriota bacterium]